jgi:DNA-binding winged helix-turn-helix (wHTH) protein/tetratricopeptide (TPR) repeat protein
MTVYRFGKCELDSAQHRLRVAGIERHVEPQVFDLLHFLAEKGDGIVTRDELIERVWNGRIVSDSAISVRINAARKVIGDTGARQDLIKTVPRRGFRLAVDVKRIDDSVAANVDPERSDPTARPEHKPVVGVFPFDALGEELPSYLVRGIVEDIATELSRFHDIEVIAPFSTFRHDFGREDRFAVARSLGITHLVTGSLKGDSSIQRVNVALLDANSGNSLWSERYDIHGNDLFAAQDDAVVSIVTALAQGLIEHMSDVARRKPARNLSAYECLLRGLQIYKWGVNSIDGAGQARFWFERAIELDPDFARARAWRECCFSSFWSSPPTDAELDGSAQRMNVALSLDEGDHEVHRLKGALHMCSGEFELGEYHLAKAVELNPNDAHILISIGMYRSFLAENTDDLTYIDTAFRRNPLHPAWYWSHRGIALFAHGEYEEAIRGFRRSGVDSEVTCLYLAAANALLDRSEEANKQIEKLREFKSDADTDWLKVAYPTRCYEDSESKRLFFEGLRQAGL